MDYQLNPAASEHVAQIAEIWHAGWHEAHGQIVPAELVTLRTMESFLERSEENLSGTWIAVSDATVLGFCMVREDELYQMYVSPAARGGGVAKTLIGDAEKRILGNGYQIAWLACAKGNSRAMRFYEKSGWNMAGNEVVGLDTSQGAFPLDVLRYEKKLVLS